MPYKAKIASSNFPRPSKTTIKVGTDTHHAADYETTQRILWLAQNDLLALHQAIQSQPTEPHKTVITTTYMVPSDSIVYGNAAGGAFTIYLPPASQVAGQIFTVKRINGGFNNVTVATVASPGQTSPALIDGAPTVTLNAQYMIITIHCDGANFWLV